MSDIKDKVKIRVGAGKIVSQIGFFWVFWFIYRVKKAAADFKDLNLVLRKTETSKYNDTILDEKWKEEIIKAQKENRYQFFFIFKYFVSFCSNFSY
jgi:hypothetical protein